MKNLALVALLFVAALCQGQAYSSLALQNSPGSYARAIPYAQLTVCISTDTATPCTQKATIFSDDSLTTPCTATSSSGTLTNAPISGANCNNPGISDANGNFTIFALAGNYRLCTYGQTTLCHEITVGGGGTGNITCPGAIYGGLAAWLNSTTIGCTNLAYTDFLGGVFAQFFQAIGPVNGEVKMTTVGVVPILALPANTISWVAPNVVPTSLRMNVPGVECTDGQVWQQLSHGPDPTGTENVYFNCFTAGTGGGSVTSFSAGTLSPIFTTSVATSTTTPALSFILTNAAAHTFLGNTSGSSGAPSYSALPVLSLPCESGIGDGFNVMPAQTYPQTYCINKSGGTWTLTRIACYTDNNGTSTLNVTNGAGTALLTGAITCTNAIAGAAGTQSGTTTIADGDGMKFSFVADGTSKQVTFVVNYTQLDQ